MDVRQLSYFVAVVDHGGFTKAAAAVHVAQPSMSVSMGTLEAELGVELFERVGRSVRLTAAGWALVEPARQVLRDLEHAKAAVAAVRGVAGGRLDVVCLPTLAWSPVGELVGLFRRAHPDVAVRISEPDDPAGLAAVVRSGRADVGFTELPVEAGDLLEMELSSQEYLAIVPRSWGMSEVVPITELAIRPLITTRKGTSSRRLIDAAFRGAGVTPIVAVETDNREVIAQMVRAGAGYSILPRTVVERIASADERALRLETPITRRVGIIHRRGKGSPAACCARVAGRISPAFATRLSSSKITATVSRLREARI